MYSAKDCREFFAVSVFSLIFCSTHSPVTPGKDDLQVLGKYFSVCCAECLLFYKNYTPLLSAVIALAEIKPHQCLWISSCLEVPGTRCCRCQVDAVFWRFWWGFFPSCDLNVDRSI